MDDLLSSFQARIREAVANSSSLRIVGSGSKDFYGGALIGEPLNTGAYTGIIDYEPAELVITARSGTPLADLEATLAGCGQMLAFEPPRFGGLGTLGGAVAAGLSGPRRAYTGAVRDYVLGLKVIDGHARLLHFGGQVIKNVAGFDVSRLMTGALGTLGLITEVSLKLLPRPAVELTLMYETDESTALRWCNEWAGRPLPLSGTCYLDGRLCVRLSGAQAAVQEARGKLGGDALADDATFWNGVRDQTSSFFADSTTLWRISLAATAPPLQLHVPQLIEWGGALRWASGTLDAQDLRERVARVGGHVTLFRGRDQTAGTFHVLAPGIDTLHRRLKQAFDPAHVFNRGRMYAHI
jgi:glycolate oxidase FAD binding subunit